MHRHKPDLREVWRRLAAKYCDDESLVSRLYHELVSHYSEPLRYYHNLDHLTALLPLYFQYESDLQKPDVVLFSIFYHDVVYAAGRSDNEYQSSLVAQRALEQLGAPSTVTEDVQRFILATRHHQLPEDAHPDLKFFIDFDLSILAADRGAYQEYVLKVRKEYGHISVEQFAQGRAAFLRLMLHQEHIFYTMSFQVKEETARKNMQWELQMGPGIYSAR